MKPGDLVEPKTHGAWAAVGGCGVIVDTCPRWPNSPREDERIVKVLFTITGKTYECSEYDVEVISEAR